MEEKIILFIRHSYRFKEMKFRILSDLSNRAFTASSEDYVYD